MIAFQSNGYSALPRDEERPAALERSKEETKRSVEDQRRHRCSAKASEDGGEGRTGT